MLQPFFDCACNAWYPNAHEKMEMCLEASQKIRKILLKIEWQI